MKKLKYFKYILIMCILLINIYMVNAEEIIVKNGNTTKITLNNDNLELLNPLEKNVEDNLLGDTPITTNYKISKGVSNIKYEQSIDSTASKYVRTRVGVHLKDPYFIICDNNQNSIELNLDEEIKMEQDNDYYFFDVKLDLKNEDLTFNSAQDIGNYEYQSMGNSTLYLSNTDNNSINYEYKITEVGKTSGSYTEHYFADFYGTSGERVYESYIGERIDKISLSINGYTSNQQMSMKDTYTSANHVTNRTYTKNDLGTNSATSTSTLYNTLTFPYETYLNGSSYFIPQGDSSCLTSFGNYNGNIWSDSSGLKYIKGKILFTNGQTDFTTPHKLTYNHIVNQVNTHDTLQPYFNEKITTRIKIKKSDINNYRYLNLYNPTAISKSKSVGYYSVSNNASSNTVSMTNTATSPASTFTASSIHSSSAIDLLPYTNCEHEYVIKQCVDKNTHIVFCNKCKWEHEENHNFIYEYDGMTNNLCACGYIQKIKHHYEFNSSNINDYNEILIASNSYVKPNPTKTGYKHIGYKKYLKHFKDMTNPVFDIASTSIVIDYIEDIIELPVLSDYFSTIFKAKYTPIKYKVHLNSNNNKHLPINININEYECYYDEEYVLPNYDYGDYMMQGWTIASGSNIVNFKRNNAIKNISNVENDIINLYPVYDIKSYKFKFSKINNLNLTINENIADLKCNINTSYTLPNNIDIVGHTFIGWSLTENSTQIDFEPNANIYNYTSNYGSETILYPVYEKNKYIFKFSEENIFNLTLSHIDDQVFYYNQEDNIKNNINVKGYTFKGWSLVATSSNIDFYPNSKIYNYTFKNNKEYILYPVYDELSFTIVYSTQNGTYSNGSNTITKNYKLSSTDNFLIPSVPSINQTFNKDNVLISEEIAVFKNYTDLNNKAYNSLSEIKSIVYNNSNNNEIFYLNYNYTRELKKYKINNINNNNSGGSGNSGGGSGSGGNGETLFSQDYLDSSNKETNEPVIPLNPVLKANKKKKDLIDILTEIYVDWKEQNNINDKRKFDIVDLIKAIYEDFNSSHD